MTQETERENAQRDKTNQMQWTQRTQRLKAPSIAHATNDGVYTMHWRKCATDKWKIPHAEEKNVSGHGRQKIRSHVDDGQNGQASTTMMLIMVLTTANLHPQVQDMYIHS